MRATESRQWLAHLLNDYHMLIAHFGKLKSQAVLAEIFT
jgi:hypothetical protein